MKWYRKVLIALCALVLFALLLDVGLNLWIKYQLPKAINRENESPYLITYKDVSVSLWDSNILATEIVVVPKTSLKNSLDKAGIYAKIEAVRVNDFKIWDIAFNDRLRARSITIERPNVILYKRKPRYEVREAVLGPFGKIVTVSDISILKGSISIVSGKNDTPVLGAKNINIQVDGLLITEKILSEEIPFHCSSYAISCDSLDYFPNQDYRIATKRITATKTDLNIDGFEMLPMDSRAGFVSKIAKEKDLNAIICKSISINKMDWGFKKKDFYFHGSTISFDGVSANIYRSKEPPDDMGKKHLYNKLLRDLKFDLRIDTLKIRNALVEYEEEKSPEFGAGKISFSKFNALATNIRSGYKKASLPDTKIKISCRFMKRAPFNVDWRFNVMDRSDGFRISGVMTNFDARAMAPFTKPYANITTEGTIDEVRFDFSGNDLRNKGSFAVNYDDLKFTVYQKDDRKKKNKFLTFVARIFVKKDTKERLKSTEIEVRRIPEKSFYNLLWRSVGEGLKKILI